MKLLLIIDDYLPYSKKVAAKMMHELALDLQKNNHFVTVINPNYRIKKKHKVEVIDGIEVVYFKSGKIKNIPKFKRAINESLLSFNFYFNTLSFFKNKSYDGIIYFSPSIFFGPIISVLKRRWNCKTYLILRDIFPQWIIDNGLIKKDSLIHKYFNFFENLNYKVADNIGVMSDSNLNYFKKRFTNTSKYHVLFNWSSILTPPNEKYYYRKKLKLEKKIVFFYGGNIGIAQHMITLVKLSIALKKRDNMHFVFVGKGDEVDLLIKNIKQFDLKNITYLPPVNQKEYLEMLHEFDVGLFSLHPNHKTHNFPGKLLSYMNYEKPILGCVNSGNDLKDIVNHANAGFISYTTDKESLIKNAIKLAENEELRLQMGRNGKNLLKNKFSVFSASKKIQKFMS